MLDSNTIDQLKSVFESLDKEIHLHYTLSDHEKQKDLVSLITDIAQTSPKIILKPEGKKTPVPVLSLSSADGPLGIEFKGVPGGHEFTSLVLAILHSNHKGKMPDDGMIARIKRLKGPIQLATYISLSCENCPDVVQALNLMAILNPSISHTMIDGEVAPDEIERLSIQGVPSVAAGEEVLSVGKTNLSELIAMLEKKYGSEQDINANQDHGLFDVVVIGGGPAGASAAIYSARKGLKTVIVAERFGGQVQDTKGIENLISIPYTEGPKLAAQLVGHMDQYPIKKLEHRKVHSISKDSIKNIILEGGETLQAKSIIIATGAKWRELGVKGEKDYLGSGVAFCPHCDGPFYKGKDVIVIGGGNSGVEAAIDLAGIVKSVTVFEFASTMKADQVLQEKLQSLANCSVVTNAKTLEVLGDGKKVTGLRYLDRESEQEKIHVIDGIFVQIGLSPNTQFVSELVQLNPQGEILIDEKGRTNVKGIYAAGDVTNIPYKQIIIAMGEGAKVALSVFEDHTYLT
jgi:NADH-dependent peroxiredoxin subunit F